MSISGVVSHQMMMVMSWVGNGQFIDHEGGGGEHEGKPARGVKEQKGHMKNKYNPDAAVT